MEEEQEEVRYKVRMVKEFNKEFHDFWNTSIEPFMKIGWETWLIFPFEEWDSAFEDEDGYNETRLHPENNKYGINFPKSCFEPIN